MQSQIISKITTNPTINQAKQEQVFQSLGILNKLIDASFTFKYYFLETGKFRIEANYFYSSFVNFNCVIIDENPKVAIQKTAIEANSFLSRIGINRPKKYLKR